MALWFSACFCTCEFKGCSFHSFRHVSAPSADEPPRPPHDHRGPQAAEEARPEAAGGRRFQPGRRNVLTRIFFFLSWGGIKQWSLLLILNNDDRAVDVFFCLLLLILLQLEVVGKSKLDRMTDYFKLFILSKFLFGIFFLFLGQLQAEAYPHPLRQV